MHTRADTQEQTAPIRRLPLYLYGQNPTSVSADGPALLVQASHKSPLRYPLARLTRVISGPRVEWRASALAACQRERLPIVFLDTAGAPTGYLQPIQGKPSRLDTDIEELLDRADWRVYYTHWQRAERMELLQGWRQSRHAAGNQVDDTEFGELVRQHVYQPESEPALFTRHSPQAGALTAYTLQALQVAGLKPRYWDEQGKPLELARDLTQLTQLALRLEMHGLGNGLHGDNAALLRVLHSFGATIETLLPHLLGSLRRRLKNLLEEWR